MQEEQFNIGPIFIPNETSCYNCFISRKITNYENSYLSYKFLKKYNSEWNEEHISVMPGTIEMFSFHILSFVMKYFSNCLTSEIIGKEFTYNILTLSSNLNPVLKVQGVLNVRVQKESQERFCIEQLGVEKYGDTKCFRIYHK